MPVRIVLVRPELPANIGACARVVRNTGLSGLDLVEPGDWRTVDCWRTAWGAHEVLEQARPFDGLAAALADATYVAALAGRPRPGSVTLDVRELASEVAALGDDARVALVFGTESTGLTQEEMALCGRSVRIPSHPAQPSLNLSHAVAITAYEVFRAAPPRAAPRPRLATHGEKESMLALLREGLLAVRALPEANTDGFFEDWHALFQRLDLTPKEVSLLEHLARKLAQRR
ncbi:MAG TPA: RNA methyltransferase [Vicinamibacteria bacterium]|nr:RNA methyltransferase [Vicinamibacteria bacterium]